MTMESFANPHIRANKAELRVWRFRSTSTFNISRVHSVPREHAMPHSSGQ